MTESLAISHDAYGKKVVRLAAGSMVDDSRDAYHVDPAVLAIDRRAKPR
jgi:hypothetical protein